MSKTKIFTFILLSLSVGSCAKFTTRMRAKPQLVYKDGLLISNSQTNPYKFVFDNGILKVNYKIIVKNINEKPASINVENAFYEANSEKNNLYCMISHFGGKKRMLSKDEELAISCEADIIPNNINKLTLKDTDIKLSIPLDKNIYSFAYRVYAEEFVK